jgi:hypothetical protein
VAEAVRSGRTTVSISVDVKRELDELRAELGVRTYEELIRRLLDIYREYKGLSVRKIMCNDLLEARGSLAAWARLLARHFSTSDEVAAAMGYLVPDPREPGAYVVSRERCAGAGVAPEAAVEKP